MTQVAQVRDEPWNIRKVLAWTAQHFEKKGVDSARLTAEVLLAHTLKLDRVRLYTDLDRPLSKDELGNFRQLIERRVQGEPTQYLTGRREFYNRPFSVDARVLIPRPETELLVEAVLRHLPKDAPGPVRVADACTGSGCIGITLALERPTWSVWATDVSEEACAVARDNAARLGAATCQVLQGDLLEPVPQDAPLDVVVSNPPYLTEQELARLEPVVRSEPRLALDGGADGLAVVRPLARAARGRLAAGGLLALEIGEGQGEAVAQLLADCGYTGVRIEKDLARLTRYAFAIAS